MQDSKFEPWWFEAEHATTRSRTAPFKNKSLKKNMNAAVDESASTDFPVGHYTAEQMMVHTKPVTLTG